MKIAIPTESGNVCEHFGRAPEFTLVEINGDVKKEIIKNPGHKRGFLPKFLKDKEVKYLITGGIGTRAISLFEEYGIKIITGATGKIDDVIEKFKNGKLQIGENICSPGLGKDFGVEREDSEHQHKK